MALAMREISFLKLSRHPNVVHLHEAFQSNSGKVSRHRQGWSTPLARERAEVNLPSSPYRLRCTL
jgi:hypothetical protein